MILPWIKSRNPKYGTRYDYVGVLGSGSCFYLPGSRKWVAMFNARKGDNVVFLDMRGFGSALAAIKALESDLDKRSIDLFGIDDLSELMGATDADLA